MGSGNNIHRSPPHSSYIHPRFSSCAHALDGLGYGFVMVGIGGDMMADKHVHEWQLRQFQSIVSALIAVS